MHGNYEHFIAKGAAYQAMDTYVNIVRFLQRIHVGMQICTVFVLISALCA